MATRAVIAVASKASHMAAFLISSTAKMKMVQTLAEVATISSNRTRSPTTMVVPLQVGSNSTNNSTQGLRLLIHQTKQTKVALLSVSITRNSTDRFHKLEQEIWQSPNSLRLRKSRGDNLPCTLVLHHQGHRAPQQPLRLVLLVLPTRDLALFQPSHSRPNLQWRRVLRCSFSPISSGCV